MENTSQQDMLQDVEQELMEYASVGQRFLNYLIDLISLLGIWFLVVFMIAASNPDSEFIQSLDNINPLLDRLLTLISFGLYVAIFEGATKGRTLGKLITGTIAVRADNMPFTWSDAFLRGFSRMVPFEAFSAFGGHPWHDRWTNTHVIKVRK